MCLDSRTSRLKILHHWVIVAAGMLECWMYDRSDNKNSPNVKITNPTVRTLHTLLMRQWSPGAYFKHFSVGKTTTWGLKEENSYSPCDAIRPTPTHTCSTQDCRFLGQELREMRAPRWRGVTHAALCNFMCLDSRTSRLKNLHHRVIVAARMLECWMYHRSDNKNSPNVKITNPTVCTLRTLLMRQ